MSEIFPVLKGNGGQKNIPKGRGNMGKNYNYQGKR